ncbi:uncharacterized protein LOC142765915 [Rhipicephalus microplus]|uniref:uncharacterized protein LOC142765915 n=1 Tax=Rhipicephalus microplus TaxID=6941 RepID=UPI003F6CCE41
MASGGPTLDTSEDDANPPWQERKPVRNGSTLVVYLPVPPAIECCELGCGATYNPATWTSRRQSLEQHLKAEHGTRITSTSYICSLCGDVLGQRTMAHVNKCLANVPTSAPSQCFRHQCEKCPRSFPSRKGLHNHQQWHLREEAKQARQNVAAGAPPLQPPTSATGSTSPHQQASPGRSATPKHPKWWPPPPCRVAPALHRAKRNSSSRPPLIHPKCRRRNLYTGGPAYPPARRRLGCGGKPS